MVKKNIKIKIPKVDDKFNKQYIKELKIDNFKKF